MTFIIEYKTIGGWYRSCDGSMLINAVNKQSAIDMAEMIIGGDTGGAKVISLVANEK